MIVFIEMGRLNLTVLALLLAIGSTLAQDANCDFTQNVQPGTTYYIYSQNYPDSYPSGVQCRWIATCPRRYNCHLSCPLVQIPESSGCSMDRLLISRSGDPQLSSADQYCGSGSFMTTSIDQRISIGLITSKNSTGGRFYCELTAVPASSGNCSCGYKKTLRIVGGEETGVNEFPMMAGVVDVSISQIKCGGAIISDQYILTAAHCLSYQSVNNVAVVVGEHDVNTADSPATQAFRVDDFIIHPQYNENNYDYDIAIIRLRGRIEFSDRVGPVCLPFKFRNKQFAGARVTLLGYGTTEPGGPTSDVLRKVDVDVISQSSCRSRVSSLTSRQICTYTPGKDACQDDSGGPVLYTDRSNGLLYSLGIISYGRFCASGVPGINTRVTTLLNWIETNTPDATYCKK